MQSGALQAPPAAGHRLHRGAVQDAQQEPQASRLRTLATRRRRCCTCLPADQAVELGQCRSQLRRYDMEPCLILTLYLILP